MKKVYIVLEDYGNYDGGAIIRAVFAEKERAEVFLNEVNSNSSVPEWRVEEHSVE